MSKITIELLEHTPFLNDNQTFNLEKALLYSIKLGNNLYNENGCDEKIFTKNTLNGEQNSIYDHVNIGLKINNIPKILAMILNSEKYHKFFESNGNYVESLTTEQLTSNLEKKIYNKWQKILEKEIHINYDDLYSLPKIKKLANINASYFLSIFRPTNIISTIPLGQLNKMIVLMKKISEKEDRNEFETKLLPAITQLVNGFSELNLVCEELQLQTQNSDFSFFAKEKKREHFNATYITKYQASFAQLAQIQKHNASNYEVSLPEYQKGLIEKPPANYYVPPLIKENKNLQKEWENDMNKLDHLYPQGKLIEIIESGTLESFLLKVKEEMCVESQIELFNQIKETLLKYKYKLGERDQFLMRLIEGEGLRCSFKDYNCVNSCQIPKEKILARKI